MSAVRFPGGGLASFVTVATLHRHMKILQDRPWLVVVAGLGFFVALSIAFLVIAVRNPPILMR